MSPYKIVKNAAQCKLCLTIIESKHQHDFVSCKCGEIFVDGGTEYLRSGAGNFNNFISLAEQALKSHDELKKDLAYMLESEEKYGPNLYSDEINEYKSLLENTVVT